MGARDQKPAHAHQTWIYCRRNYCSFARDPPVINTFQKIKICYGKLLLRSTEQRAFENAERNFQPISSATEIVVEAAQEIGYCYSSNPSLTSSVSSFSSSATTELEAAIISALTSAFLMSLLHSGVIWQDVYKIWQSYSCIVCVYQPKMIHFVNLKSYAFAPEFVFYFLKWFRLY